MGGAPSCRHSPPSPKEMAGGASKGRGDQQEGREVTRLHQAGGRCLRKGWGKTPMAPKQRDRGCCRGMRPSCTLCCTLARCPVPWMGTRPHHSGTGQQPPSRAPQAGGGSPFPPAPPAARRQDQVAAEAALCQPGQAGAAAQGLGCPPQGHSRRRGGDPAPQGSEPAKCCHWRALRPRGALRAPGRTSLQNLTRVPGLGTGSRPTSSFPVELLLHVLVPCRAREPDQLSGAPSLETSKKNAGGTPAGEKDAQATPGLQVLSSAMTSQRAADTPARHPP